MFFFSCRRATAGGEDKGPSFFARIMNRRQFSARTLAAAVAAGVVSRTNAAADRIWRVGVIGHTGRGDYGHGIDTMWRRVPRSVVAGVADADDAGREAAAERLGGVPGFAGYRAMLAEVRPDIVAVAPRHIDQHHAMCLAAAAAGVRGIYVEKPFCRTPGEADEIVSACAAAGVKLAVAHRNRYSPVLPVVRDLVRSGEIGTVLEIRGRGKEDSRGGALDAWVLGTHVFDLAAALAGPPVACAATLYQDQRPCTRDDIREGSEGVGLIAGNRVHARFDMSDGTPFFFDSIQGRGDPAAAFGLQIAGAKGVIDFRIDRDPLVHIRRGNPNHPSADALPWIPIGSDGIGRPEPIAGLAQRIASHQAAAEDLIDAIENDRSPLCDAEAGRLTVEMVCALFESHRQGGGRIPWPLPTRGNPLATGDR